MSKLRQLLEPSSTIQPVAESDLFVGRIFPSFGEFETCVRNYGHQNNTLFVKSDCRKLAHMPGEYDYATMVCKHGGRMKKSISKGLRGNLTTAKCGCPVAIRVISQCSASGKITYRVTKVKLEHNHVVPQSTLNTKGSESEAIPTIPNILQMESKPELTDLGEPAEVDGDNGLEGSSSRKSPKGTIESDWTNFCNQLAGGVAWDSSSASVLLSAAQSSKNHVYARHGFEQAQYNSLDLVVQDLEQGCLFHVIKAFDKFRSSPQNVDKIVLDTNKTDQGVERLDRNLFTPGQGKFLKLRFKVEDAIKNTETPLPMIKKGRAYIPLQRIESVSKEGENLEKNDESKEVKNNNTSQEELGRGKRQKLAKSKYDDDFVMAPIKKEKVDHDKPVSSVFWVNPVTKKQLVSSYTVTEAKRGSHPQSDCDLEEVNGEDDGILQGALKKEEDSTITMVSSPHDKDSELGGICDAEGAKPEESVGVENDLADEHKSYTDDVESLDVSSSVFEGITFKSEGNASGSGQDERNMSEVNALNADEKAKWLTFKSEGNASGSGQDDTNMSEFNALTADEKAKWLSERFVKAYGGKKPTERKSFECDQLAPIMCSRCDTYFPSSKDIRRHWLISHDDTVLNKKVKIYKCDKCPLTFGPQFSYKVHYRLHTGARPHPCLKCEMSFRIISQLQEHMKIHERGPTEEHCCFVCFKIFPDAQLFERHMSFHREEEKQLHETVKEHDVDIEYVKMMINQNEANETQDSETRQDVTSSSTEKDAKLEANSKNLNELSKLTERYDFECDQNVPIVCCVCKLQCSSTEELTDHWIKEHRIKGDTKKERKYACLHCELKTPQFYQMRLHNRIHSGAKPHICPICKHDFRLIKGLREHLTRHRQEQNSFFCPLCSKTYNSLTRLKVHIKLHKQNRPRPYVCDVCGKCFHKRCVLNNHKQIHSQVKAFKCDICEARFAQRCGLKLHRRRHNQIAFKYVCDQCGKSFATGEQMTNHRRVHTGEKPYACSLCSHKCRTNGQLKNHMTVHRNEKPFACQIPTCSSRFKRLSHLFTHHRALHPGQKPYRCDSCGDSYERITDLRQHCRATGCHTRNLTIRSMGERSEKLSGMDETPHAVQRMIKEELRLDTVADTNLKAMNSTVETYAQDVEDVKPDAEVCVEGIQHDDNKLLALGQTIAGALESIQSDTGDIVLVQESGDLDLQSANNASEERIFIHVVSEDGTETQKFIVCKDNGETEQVFFAS